MYMSSNAERRSFNDLMLEAVKDEKDLTKHGGKIISGIEKRKKIKI